MDKHAENARRYAQDMLVNDKAWELWEHRYIVITGSTWIKQEQHPTWGSDIEYRRVNEYRELEEAQADGKYIQFRAFDGTWVSKLHEKWEYPPEKYRVKPETKKIKLYAWFTGMTLVYQASTRTRLDDWIRVPSEDKVIEIEEKEND